jgi:hypothetical protein
VTPEPLSFNERTSQLELSRWNQGEVSLYPIPAVCNHQC